MTNSKIQPKIKNPAAVQKFAEDSFELLIDMQKAMESSGMKRRAELLKIYIDFVENYEEIQT